MASNITAGEFISALHEDMDRVTDLVRDDLEDSNSFVMGLIPDGGDITDNTQTDTIEYSTAKPAYIGYNNRDNSPRALVEGSMEARAINGTNKSFTTDVNERDPNACDGGICEFKYAQGFKRFRAQDFERPMETPVFCANHYLRMGDDHVNGFIDGLFESYRKYGMNNFEAELQNRVIEFGQANSSITADGLQLTKGGWHAVPTSRLTIHHLLEYRDYMEYEDALDADGYLVIEAPRQDWFDAVEEHQIRKNPRGNLVQYPTEILKDERAQLYGRDFHIFENIKCYFNERPVRGYFKPDGINPVTNQTQLSFTRVFPHKNVVNEEGGLSAEPNHDYNKPKITVDGASYNMVTLAFHIHETAFKRYRIKEAMKPVGESVVPTNFSITVLDGPWIPNNKMKTQFQLVSNHAYRLKSMKTERAGAIAYRHSRPDIYIVEPTGGTDFKRVTDPNVLPESFEKCAPDQGSIDNCAKCDQVPNDNHDCVDVPAETVISMTPSSGAINHLNEGESSLVSVTVNRGGSFDQEATVDFALSALGAAVAGTNYTDTSGTLTFAAGETTKVIEIEILDGAGLDGVVDGVKLELSNPGGSTPVPTLEDDFLDIIIIDATA
jgi:hypothetical protein|tara:strand:- start:217 stop:2040 length:1824 start_codon:yes stop_codon:yes gene_type:complete